MKKRILTLLLALCCAGSSAATALAANAADSPQVEDSQSIIVNAPDEDDPQNYRALHKIIDESIFGDLDGSISKEFGVNGTENKVSYLSPFNNALYQVPESYNVYDGIDVSYHNGYLLGTSINWKKVANDGVDFAFIRAGYRGYGAKGTIQEDKDFAYNMRNAKANGIPVGIYFFSQATTTEEAVVEAQYSVNRLKKYGFSIELPIVMDYEFYGSEGRLYDAHLSKAQMTANALAFCQTVSDAGYQPMVYANKSFMNNNLDKNTVSAAAPIWLAHYTRNTNYIGDYDCWQYSDGNTKVDGIQGAVDCNFYFKKGALLEPTSNYETPPAAEPEPETPAEPAPQPVSGYTDVYTNDWFANAVSFVSDQKIMTGTDPFIFNPNIPVSRSMIAQIMYSLSGKKAVAYSNYFTDVPAGEWFSDAVIWTKESNVMNGYGSEFGINDYITREDFATAMYRYSKSQGIDVSQTKDLGSFTDSSQISEYAIIPLQWAAANGLMTGRDTDKTLVPKGQTTRAECATILANYLNNIGSSLLSK